MSFSAVSSAGIVLVRTAETISGARKDSGSNCPTYRVDGRVTAKRLEAE
jgi:hypothetical protein